MSKLPPSRVRCASLRVRFTTGEMKALTLLIEHSYSVEDRPAPSTFMHDLAVAFIYFQKRKHVSERAALGSAISHSAHKLIAASKPALESPTVTADLMFVTPASPRVPPRASQRAQPPVDPDEEADYISAFFEEIMARAVATSSTTVVEKKK